MMKKIFFILCFFIFSNSKTIIRQNEQVILFDPLNEKNELLHELLKSHNVESKITSNLSHDSQNIYIISNAHLIELKNLPDYFIVYQTFDCNQILISPAYETILKKAIAIWEPEKTNLDVYKNSFKNFHYFPSHFADIDAILLPCFLKTSALSHYKRLLEYENNFDSDISSHLPIIFSHTALVEPKEMLEIGVRGGESTQAFKEVLSLFSKSSLLGIDIDPGSAHVYNGLTKSTFICLNDLDFAQYYKSSSFNETLFDIIFIDTSHAYEHTIQELTLFKDYLNNKGLFILHDSNVTPLNNNSMYQRLNGTFGHALGNPRGVTQGIKEFLSIHFDESLYYSDSINKDDITWNIWHYPFCNGLTILQKTSL